MKWTDYVIAGLCVAILFSIINLFYGLYKKTQVYCDLAVNAMANTQSAESFYWEDDMWAKSYPYETE